MSRASAGANSLSAKTLQSSHPPLAFGPMEKAAEVESEANTEPELPWPDVPRVGFGPGDARHLDADVKWAQSYGEHGMFGYVEGYRRAATAVFEAATRDRQSPAYSVWPLAFLWRHHLELAMKDIIAVGREIEGDDGFPPHHRLLDLWREVRKHIEVAGHDEDPALPNVEMSIKEFDKIDPTGEGFRYPVTKDLRSRSLPNVPSHINLARLHEAMEAVATFLDCARTALGERLDLARELAAY